MSKKYKLLRKWVDKYGSPRFPGIYHESKLPEKIKKDPFWCLPCESIEVARTPKKDKDLIEYNIREKDLELGVEETIAIKNEVKETVNINTGKLKELMSVKGIGTATAQKIIKGRPYTEVGDIQVVVHNIDTIDLNSLTV